jgi:hypothetical protein
VKAPPGSPAEIIAAMATVLWSKGTDLGDERAIFRDLLSATYGGADILRYSELATERARVMRARDADRMQRQFLDGERIR